MKLPHHFIEGYESASCSVNAIALFYGISYQEAWVKMQALGRCQEYGVVFTDIAYVLELLCKPELANMRLGKVLPKLKPGKFIVRVRGHVFAVIDGVIYDTFEQSSNKEVLMVYENKT